MRADRQRLSQIAVCLKAAPSFLIAADDALALTKHQIVTIRDRDSMTQERLPIEGIKRAILDKLSAARS